MNLQEQISRIKSMMGIISEKLEDIQGMLLYHLTSTDNGLKIINSDKIVAGLTDKFHLDFDKRLMNSDKKKAISFTRNKNWGPRDTYEIGGGVLAIEDLEMIFVLDKEKLKTRYSVVPFSYSGLGSDKSNFLRSDENEFEERVLTDKITHLHKYIVDILYKGNDPKVQEIIDIYLNR